MSGNATDPLQGAVAVVTGGGTGIGRATARRLGGRGFAVVLAGRRVELLDEALGEVEAAGGRGLTLACDLADAGAAAALVDAATEVFGRLDAIVNNAATITVKPLAEWTPAEF